MRLCSGAGVRAKEGRKVKASRAILVNLFLMGVIAVYYLPDIIARDGAVVFGHIQDISSVYGFYPWDIFSLRELASGRFPLWNPFNALGEPHLAHMQSALFYPLTWLKFIFGMKLLALDLLLLLRLFAAGAFTYLFSRKTGLKTAPSLVAAVSFMLTGYFTRHIYMSHLNVETLIPLVMLVFLCTARGGGLKWLVASSAAVWLAIVGGFPEATFYTLGLCGLFYMWAAPVRRWPLLFGAGALGALASAAQLLPFIEYLSRAWFYHPGGIGSFHRDLEYLFTLWVPWFFGTNDKSPLAPFLVPYFGLLPIALAMVSLKRRSPRAGTLFFAAACLVCLGLIYGVPPFVWLARLPPLDITLNYKYAVPAAAFCACMLAGAGAEELLDGRSAKMTILCALALALVIPAVVLIDGRGGFAPFSRRADWPLFIQPLGQAAALVTAATLAYKKRLKMAAVVTVLAAAWLPVEGNRPVYNPAAMEAEKSPEASYLAEHRGRGRFAAEEHILFPNLNLLLDLDDLRYYSPVYTREYASFIQKADGIGDRAGLVEHFADHSMLTPVVNALGNGLWEHADLEWWLGEGPPGTTNLLPMLISRGDWITPHQDMIGRKRVKFGGTERPGLFMHAPGKVSLAAKAPEGASLMFAPLMLPEARGCSDGAYFTCTIGERGSEKVIFSAFLDSSRSIFNQYIIPMDAYWGKEITINLMISPGPGNDDRCDWTAWLTPYMGDMKPAGWEKLSIEGGRVWKRTGISRMARPAGCPSDKASFERISSQEYIVEAGSCPGGKIVLGTVYYPGWKAFRGGRELKISREEGAFGAVDGGGRIRLVYEPSSFAAGLWFTVAGLLSGLGVLTAKLVKSRTSAGGG